ncbi:MAG TPA: murein L,D-transpeptidase catalytic domain family protein [Kofleriaceae bacterium]|nr:murein L,D-transpeptidase catalytic domain family protein [Kofleriaceae bacterium]
MGSCALTWSVRAVVLLLVLAACSTDEDLSSTEQAVVDPTDFTLPTLTTAQRAAIVHKYDALDPMNQVPRGLLEDAMVYYDVNFAAIPKHSYFVVIDFSLYSGKDRFWLVNTTTGAVEKHKVAHGDGSDPDNNGYADSFGNVSGSNKSSLGFYLTGEIYDGTHPHSMRLDGLSPDGSPNGMANTNVRSRAIVVHEASYVSDSNTSQQGRSNGCPALDSDIEVSVVDRIHDGSLMYGAISPLNPPIGRGDGAPCGTIPATGAVIDDGDACFAARGPATGLHSETSAGMGGSLVWTHATAVANEQNYAEWTLFFDQPGRYSVEVYTDASFAQSRQAHYTVVANGIEHDVTIDQTAANGYQKLGDFDFAQGGGQLVHVGDNTAEASKPQLVFDAVRITPVSDGSDDGGAADDPGMTDDPGDSSGCAATHSSAGALFGLALLFARRRRRR